MLNFSEYTNEIKPYARGKEVNPHNWTYSVEYIGPSEAISLLEGNQGNRPLKKTVVSRYAATMVSGNWILSPEPICISKQGRLLNGQHRLNAVVSSGCCVGFLVIRDVNDSVFKVLDRGSTRTIGDAIGVNKRLAEVARLAAVLSEGSLKNQSAVLDAEVEEVAYVLKDSHDLLMSHCQTTAKVFSSAPFRLSACVRILSGHNTEYVLDTYKDLILGHVANLPPIAQTVVGSVLSGRWDSLGTSGGGSRQALNIARAWDLFNYQKSHNTKLSIRSVERANKEILKILSVAIKGAN